MALAPRAAIAECHVWERQPALGKTIPGAATLYRARASRTAIKAPKNWALECRTADQMRHNEHAMECKREWLVLPRKERPIPAYWADTHCHQSIPAPGRTRPCDATSDATPCSNLWDLLPCSAEWEAESDWDFLSRLTH